MTEYNASDNRVSKGEMYNKIHRFAESDINITMNQLRELLYYKKEVATKLVFSSNPNEIEMLEDSWHYIDKLIKNLLNL